MKEIANKVSVLSSTDERSEILEFSLLCHSAKASLEQLRRRIAHNITLMRELDSRDDYWGLEKLLKEHWELHDTNKRVLDKTFGDIKLLCIMLTEK